MTALTNDGLRELERASIRAFLESHLDLLRGRVLDFGSGRSPYADIVNRAGGVYIPYDRVEYPGNVSGEDVGPDEMYWGDLDAIVMTQVTQYVTDLEDLLGAFCDVLRGGDPGVLVATGPTTWPIVEASDLHRHTPNGVELLLLEAGFRQVKVEERASVECGDVRFVIGWKAVAIA